MCSHPEEYIRRTVLGDFENITLAERET